MGFHATDKDVPALHPEIENYKKSFEKMWGEIATARKQRDEALKIVDTARDLVLALDHDFGCGETRVSLKTHEAFSRLKSWLLKQ